MAESFGARLRQHREERQIDLIHIAAQTKIKLSLLEELERGDVSHWPSGIFRRAYIKSYAQMVGLDADAVLREFLQVHPDPVDVLAELAAQDAQEAAARPGGPPTRLRTIVDSALGSLARLRRPVDDARPAQAAPGRTAPPAFEPEPLDLPLPDALLHMADDAPREPGALLEEAETPDAHEPELRFAAPAVKPDPLVLEAPAAERVAVDAAPREAEQGYLPEPPAAAEVSAADAAPAVAAEDISLEALTREVHAAHEDRLETIAHLCTELGRVVGRHAVQQILQDSARLLDARGLIVWLWDEELQELRPSLVHGYSQKVLVCLPPVTREADNATAEAFRTANVCEVLPAGHTNGAIVLPLLMPEGCTGVLAIELQQGEPPTRLRRAMATVLAAAVTQLVNRSRFAEAPRRATSVSLALGARGRSMLQQS